MEEVASRTFMPGEIPRECHLIIIQFVKPQLTKAKIAVASDAAEIARVVMTNAL